jgi:hypothetical protein
MGIDDKVLGEITKKLGISGDQAKAALDKILPFAKGKLGALGGGNVGLLSQIKSTDLTPDEEDEVVKSSGLPAEKVRELQTEVMSFLKR